MDYKKLVRIADAVNTKYFVALHTGRDGYGEDQVEGRTMTVGELISYLEGFDEDEPVMYNNDNGYTYGGVGRTGDEEGYVYLHTSRDGYAPSQITRTASVGELINDLSQYDEEWKVLYSNDNGYTLGYISEDRIDEEEMDVEEEEESYSADEEILNKMEDEDDFTWYKGTEFPGGCWYTIESYVLAEDLENLLNKLKEAFKGRIDHFKKLNSRSYKFVIWDSEKDREEYSGE